MCNFFFFKYVLIKILQTEKKIWYIFFGSGILFIPVQFNSFIIILAGSTVPFCQQSYYHWVGNHRGQTWFCEVIGVIIYANSHNRDAWSQPVCQILIVRRCNAASVEQ